MGAGNYEEIKIMYDGTILPCHQLIYETSLDSISDEKTLINEAKKIFIKKPLGYLNINTATDDEIKFYQSIYKTAHEDTFWHKYSLNIINMYYLALANQISNIYLTSIDSLLVHGLIVTFFNGCAYNQMIQTGSFYTNSQSVIKRICNGWGTLLEYTTNLDTNGKERLKEYDVAFGTISTRIANDIVID